MAYGQGLDFSVVPLSLSANESVSTSVSSKPTGTEDAEEEELVDGVERLLDDEEEQLDVDEELLEDTDESGASVCKNSLTRMSSISTFDGLGESIADNE